MKAGEAETATVIMQLLDETVEELFSALEPLKEEVSM